ncbi:MAG: choline dehydrogenase [Chloroflexi bacterium]|nr:choline dehydrogenase [Chloroflexota bacterium]
MFDYIIIGGGSAGCVLANRLTEDTGVRVLLLEAGESDKRWQIHTPAAFSQLFKSSCDWAYETEPQSQLENRRLYMPRGKVLGGSSSINAMIYTRGHRYDYDLWRDLGNPGWGFENIIPYFRRAENQVRGKSEYHGIGGPLNVEDLQHVNPLTHAFVKACEEIGIRGNDDFCGPHQDGVGCYQVTQKHGKRHSAAAAYIAPVRHRPHLTVLTNSLVTQLQISRNRVVGVDYLQEGMRQSAVAHREIILAGGAIGSPQLLMLSGIGPADHLRSLDIPVVQDVPGVGRNLQDHLGIILTYRCTRPVSLVNAERLGSVLQYLLFKRGPLTSNVSEAGAFIRTEPGQPAPDLQVGFVPAYAHNRGFHRPRGHFFSIGCTYLRPFSHGFVQLRSREPLEPPIIQPEYLSHPQDRCVLVEGVKLCRRIIQERSFADLRGNELFPGEEVQGDEAVLDFIRAFGQTVDHPVGTCKMGTDPMAVVDPELRVHGVEGLRVIDASIMPTVISGNTNAPVIMIAEKAADMIRGIGPSQED